MPSSPPAYTLYLWPADRTDLPGHTGDAYLLTLGPSLASERTALLHGILVTLTHPPLAETYSLASPALSSPPVLLGHLSSDWLDAVREAIRCPPTFPGRALASFLRLRQSRIPVSPRSPGVLPPLDLSRRPPPSPVSFASLVSLPSFPCRPMGDRPLLLLRRWGISCTHPLGTILLGQAELHIKRWARLRGIHYSNEVAVPSPPLPAAYAASLIRGLPVTVSARREHAPGCCPTLLSNPSNHPIHISTSPARYFSTPLVLGLFELPATDRLHSILLALDPQLSYRLVANGVSLRALLPASSCLLAPLSCLTRNLTSRRVLPHYFSPASRSPAPV